MVNWKYITIAIAVVAAIVVAILLVKRKSISFDFDMGSNISSVLGLLQGRYANRQNEKIGAYIDIPITTKINNGRKAAAVLNNISGSISYAGNPIIQTNLASTSLQKVTVPGHSITPVSDNVQLLINESSIKFLTDLVQNKNPLIQYNFNANVAGKPYSFNKTTTIKKS